MKKIIRLLIAFIALSFTVSGANASEQVPTDTTFHFNKKIIKIEDSTNQVKVKVFEMSAKDTVPYQQIFEGIYSDGKSSEKYTVIEEIGLKLPFLTNKIKKQHKDFYMKPHWSGFGFGYANITNSALKMTTVDHVSLRPDKSDEWTLNLEEKIIPIYRNNIGITTGLGLDWRNYYLDYNTYLADIDGKTNVYDAPDNVHYKSSRLKLVHITLPLLLEWQPSFGQNHHFFVSGGLIGGIKIFSSYKMQYVDIDGNTVTNTARGLNTTPLSLDYFGQIGYKSISVYAKYSPFSLFDSGKGPNIRSVSLGLMVHF